MPPVLTAPVVWKKPRPADKTRSSSDLTPEEQANVKIALRALRIRFGGVCQLGTAINVKEATLIAAVSRRGKPSAGVALRAARAAKVPLEDLLSGAWPKAGSCPMCGRCDEP
jgi:hypothetical protein